MLFKKLVEEWQAIDLSKVTGPKACPVKTGEEMVIGTANDDIKRLWELRRIYLEQIIQLNDRPPELEAEYQMACRIYKVINELIQLEVRVAFPQTTKNFSNIDIRDGWQIVAFNKNGFVSDFQVIMGGQG